MAARRPQALPAGTPPPRLPLSEIILRNLALVIVPVVLLGLVGLIVGLARAPVYTSEARLNVGGLDLTTETIPGYTTAVGDLAISYARALGATGVLEPISSRTGLSGAQILQDVAATPVQGSPVINVDATSKDAQQAVNLANATADALVTYSRALNVNSGSSRDLLGRYKEESRILLLDEAKARRLPRGSRARHLQDVQINVARLQAQADATLYGQSLEGEATQQLVQKLAPAGQPTSDRSSFLQRVVGGGLLAGLLIGLGIVLARGNQVSRARLRRFPRE